jgi:TonB family protein
LSRLQRAVTIVIFCRVPLAHKLRVLQPMRHLCTSMLPALVCGAFLLSAISIAQDKPSDPEIDRKVMNRVVPSYPELARSMNLKGSVRLEAVVAPNGKVKSVVVRGGHPVLAQAAEDAIYKWKWAPAKHETREPIEVKFDPH